jgi:N-acetyltransferase B complex (NatB) non catalytic subunit.
LFLDQYFDKLAAFDDVKGYVSELSFEEMQGFLDVLPGILDEVRIAHRLSSRDMTDQRKNTSKARLMALKALECRLRYLLTTCPQTLTSQSEGSSQCLMCSNQASLPCEHCLRKIVVEASAAYNEINSDKEILEHIPTLDKDPRLDLAFAIAMSLLKLSGLRPRTFDPTSSSLWQDVNPGLFLQAVLLLDSQLKFTPNNVELRLLLVQLYLLLGCASYAYQLWNPLGVKRTIQDALSPLFFDRISSLSPGLFQGSVPPTEKLRSFYNQSLRDNSPVRIWDAFLAGSYTSILDMSEYDSRLRRSCTLMMTVVEERRARRCYGARQECEIEAHPLLGKFPVRSIVLLTY